MARRFAPILVLLAACWVVFGLNALIWHGELVRHGILPRHADGLPGILWSPFLHASFKHLSANSVPLLVMGGILCMRGRGEFVLATVFGIALGGGLTWLFAREAYHVGASGLIFCYFGYLGSLAIFQRTFGTFLISLACIVAYGGMLRGILPGNTPVSWEGHAAGLVSGIAAAWIAVKTGLSARTALGRIASGSGDH